MDELRVAGSASTFSEIQPDHRGLTAWAFGVLHQGNAAITYGFHFMGMRLTETLRLLSQARQFVIEGERYISEQKAFVDSLDRGNEDATDAIQYLETLEGMQAQYVDHLEKLERQVMIMVRPRGDEPY